MPDNHCYGSLQVCRLRVAALTETGAPDSGATNGYISDALIMATLDLQVDEGTEHLQKNGCGDICSRFIDCDKVKGVNVALELCQLDSELIGLLTGAQVFTDVASGDAIGIELPDLADDCPNGVCLELWTLAWDGSSQATPPSLSGSIAYWHFVIPKYRPQPSAFTLEDGILAFPLKGPGESNPNITVNGPFDDWDTDVVDQGGIRNSLGWFLDANLPATTCGYVNVPSAAS